MVGLHHQRCALEQLGCVRLLCAIVPQRTHLVANCGDDEYDRHESEESYCLPESLASQSGSQLPQLAGEVHHDSNHQYRQCAAHQGAKCAQLNRGKAERPQCDREAECLGRGDTGNTAANGSPNTNSAITSSAADRLPASPSVVPV